jgi:phosphatidate cytidylyltransferase
MQSHQQNNVENEPARNSSILEKFQINKLLIVCLLLIPLLGMIYAPISIFSVFASLITFAVLREFYSLCGIKQNKEVLLLGALIGFGITFSFLFEPGIQSLAVAMAISVALIMELSNAMAIPPTSSLTRFTSLVSGWFYIAVPLGFFIKIREQVNGSQLVILVLVLVITSSTSAGYVGRIMGRTHLPNAISPKKTYEGAMGGILATTLIFILINHYIKIININFPWQFLLGLLLGILAQIGDLGKSVFKRIAGVGDSGKFISAVGGFLDLVDSYLIVVPFFYFIIAIIQKS